MSGGGRIGRAPRGLCCLFVVLCSLAEALTQAQIHTHPELLKVTPKPPQTQSRALVSTAVQAGATNSASATPSHSKGSERRDPAILSPDPSRAGDKQTMPETSSEEIQIEKTMSWTEIESEKPLNSSKVRNSTLHSVQMPIYAREWWDLSGTSDTSSRTAQITPNPFTAYIDKHGSQDSSDVPESDLISAVLSSDLTKQQPDPFSTISLYHDHQERFITSESVQTPRSRLFFDPTVHPVQSRASVVEDQPAVSSSFGGSIRPGRGTVLTPVDDVESIASREIFRILSEGRTRRPVRKFTGVTRPRQLLPPGQKRRRRTFTPDQTARRRGPEASSGPMAYAREGGGAFGRRKDRRRRKMKVEKETKEDGERKAEATKHHKSTQEEIERVIFVEPSIWDSKDPDSLESPSQLSEGVLLTRFDLKKISHSSSGEEEFGNDYHNSDSISQPQEFLKTTVRPDFFPSPKPKIHGEGSVSRKMSEMSVYVETPPRDALDTGINTSYKHGTGQHPSFTGKKIMDLDAIRKCRNTDIRKSVALRDHYDIICSELQSHGTPPPPHLTPSPHLPPLHYLGMGHQKPENDRPRTYHLATLAPNPTQTPETKFPKTEIRQSPFTSQVRPKQRINPSVNTANLRHFPRPSVVSGNVRPALPISGPTPLPQSLNRFHSTHTYHKSFKPLIYPASSPKPVHHTTKVPFLPTVTTTSSTTEPSTSRLYLPKYIHKSVKQHSTKSSHRLKKPNPPIHPKKAPYFKTPRPPVPLSTRQLEKATPVMLKPKLTAVVLKTRVIGTSKDFQPVTLEKVDWRPLLPPPYQTSTNYRQLPHTHQGMLPGVPGIPALDYPVYHDPPFTSFSCLGRLSGYYADYEAECQVFHVCHQQGRKATFLCPNGTVFSETLQTCDRWRDSPCHQHRNAGLSPLHTSPPHNTIVKENKIPTIFKPIRSSRMLKDGWKPLTTHPKPGTRSHRPSIPTKAISLHTSSPTYQPPRALNSASRREGPEPLTMKPHIVDPQKVQPFSLQG